MNNIYIPSYNRSERVRTYEYLGTGHIVVPESQESLYKKRYGDAVITIPDKRDGSVSKKRNAVLDLIQERETDGYGWVCDDDFICLRRKKENLKMDGDEALEHFERLYIMAKESGMVTLKLPSGEMVLQSQMEYLTEQISFYKHMQEG